MDSVAKTSLIVAAMRALETKRSDSEGRLFSDPFAQDLAGPEGKAMVDQAIAELGDQPAIAVRTQYIDEKLKAALKSGVRQIVMIAAGMDARAYRMEFPVGTKLFELDKPEVFEYKHAKLKNVQPKCERKVIAVDLANDWTKLLVQAGFNNKEQTLWMVEGLLMYLTDEQAMSLFKRINSLASSGDIMLFDIFGRSLFKSPHMQKQLQFMADMGAPWRFGIDEEPETFMQKLGWKAEALQPGEFNPVRWPFPVAPRSVPNVPRSFFVESRRV